MTPKTFKIIQLRAENFKRLKAVTINADGHVQEIRGANGEGKSSVIDSIWAALGGKKACPEQPIRQGEKQAVIQLDLGDLIVTRTFTPKDSYLTVKNKDGATLADPQKMLDGMIGAVSFDPFEFARKSAKDQAKMLAQVAGLDFAQMNAERKVAYDARTEANREVKRFDMLHKTKEQELEGLDESQFTSLITIDDVLAEQKAAQQKHDEHKNQYVARAVRLEEELLKTCTRIEELERELAAARVRKNSLDLELDAATADVQASLSSLPDLEAIANKLRTVNDHNETVRAFAEANSLLAQYREASKQADEHDVKIMQIDREKQLQIEKAQLPIEGLLFDENGIYLNNIPFDQCCASEQLKISVALAMKLNPTIRVIRINDGSLLDSKSMDTIRELAEAEDFQVWIEIVDESTDGPGVLIQDGTIV